MGASLSEMKCCARDLGFGRDLELEKVAAATPLHHGQDVSAAVLLWAPELRLVLAAQPGHSRQREEEGPTELAEEVLVPKIVSASASSSQLVEASSKVVAYDLWSSSPQWAASTPVEEVLCMAWVPERRLLVCGGTGVKEIAALDEQRNVVWSLDSSIGRICCLVWAPELDLMLCAGRQEVAALSLEDAAHSTSWESRWLATTDFHSLYCLAWAASKGLLFAGGSYERVVAGQVVALDASKSGEQRWSVRPPVGAVLCCLWAEEPGLVLCGGNHGKLTALEADTGEQRWLVEPGVGESRQFGAYIDPGVTCLAWVRASGQLLCGGGLGRLAAMDPIEGRLLWAVDPCVGALRSLAYVPEMGGVLCCGASSKVAALVT